MPKKIIILDDNQDILDVVRETLIYEQFEVHATAQPAELIPMVKTLSPDLVILDYRVGDVNGGELCRKIKADPLYSKIPVIIFSAYINASSQLFMYGCDAIIHKPFDLDELVEKINYLIK